MTLEKDPILAALARIEAKQDLALEQQNRMEREMVMPSAKNHPR